MVDLRLLRIGDTIVHKCIVVSEIGRRTTTIHRHLVEVLGIDAVNNRILAKLPKYRNNITWRSSDEFEYLKQ